MVGESSSKVSEVKLNSKVLLPTPESPINSNLNKWSNSCWLVEEAIKQTNKNEDFWVQADGFGSEADVLIKC